MAYPPNEHEARFAEIIHRSGDARLAAMGLNLCLQPKAAVQAFADHALAHVTAMQIASLEATEA